VPTTISDCPLNRLSSTKYADSSTVYGVEEVSRASRRTASVAVTDSAKGAEPPS
jgi:hypothetical protein